MKWNEFCKFFNKLVGLGNGFYSDCLCNANTIGLGARVVHIALHCTTEYSITEMKIAP